MEATAFLVGERHSDNPRCVSPVLGAFGRNLNDVLPDDLRQDLKSLIASLPGTADDGRDGRRSYLALDWLIRTWLPTWLGLSPSCREHARRIRELGPIVDAVSAKQAGPMVREAQLCAAAAGATAGARAWDTARDAVCMAGWDAARDAARAVAWDAAGAVAGAVARAVHGAIAEAVSAAAAGDVLAPTVRELQLSAIRLYAEMIISGPAGCDEGPRADSCGRSCHVDARRRRGEQRRVRTTVRKPRVAAERAGKRSSLVPLGTGSGRQG
jgi:hypothetical protein